MLGTAALISTVGIALAISGNQLGFPIIGGASYCASLGNGGVCNSTISAGPAVTGNETIIANTNLPNGQNPQTGLLSMADLGALPYQYVVATNATTATVLSTTGKLVLDPATTLTTYGIQLPAASTLVDGQTIEISSSNTLTALLIAAGSGSTVKNNPTALTVSTTASYGYKFIYVLAQTAWYRLQ